MKPLPAENPNDPEELRKNKYRLVYKEEQDALKLCRTMARVQARLDEQSQLTKELQAEFDVLRIECVPDLFEQKGIENLKVDGLERWDEDARKPIIITGRISLTGDMFVSVPKENKPKLFAWLRKMKLGDLIQDTVNGSTFKAFVKERTIAGKKLPPEGMIKVTPYTRASITKG